MARSLCEKSPVGVEKRKLGRRVAACDRTKFAKNYQGLSRRDIRFRDSVVNWKDENVWEKIRSQGCYHKSDEIIVSCGTVTINEAEGCCPKVLVVYNNRIGIYQLPKGRKDIGEGYLEAAIRETTEETGVAVRPLRLRFGSRSTPSRSATATGLTMRNPEDLKTGVTRSLSNEMIGVSEDPDPATGAWRNIHWYAAKPCDSVQRDEACMPIRDDREKFSTHWFSEAEALSKLKLDDEKFMVRVAFQYTRNMSTDDWLDNESVEKKEGVA
ncbi:NUDIX hydrolase domain-like protein [Astrocystis sublimbata]|nr:NUDIX hydrolase domain-like protein [Astrocystis sublimbata]